MQTARVAGSQQVPPAGSTQLMLLTLTQQRSSLLSGKPDATDLAQVSSNVAAA